MVQYEFPKAVPELKLFSAVIFEENCRLSENLVMTYRNKKYHFVR